MNKENYKKLKKELDYLYGIEKYHEAVELISKVQGDLGEYYKNIMHSKALYLCKIGLYKESLDIVCDLINDNFLCGPWLIRMIPENTDDRYHSIKNLNDLLLKEADKKAKMMYKIFLPHDYNENKEYPLFIALHGGGENIEDLIIHLEPQFLTKRDFLIVYVNSQQVSWGNGYNWNDEIISRNNIKNCFEEICKKYSINKECVIISGFCGGAIATIDIVMENILPLKGFIAFSPDEICESFTYDNVLKAKNRGIKGVMLEGEHLVPVEGEEKMFKIFNETNFPYLFFINKGIGLSLPSNLDEIIENAVSYIL